MSIFRTHQKTSAKQWFYLGEHWLWMNALALSLCMLMVISLLLLIFMKGFGHFWPKDVYQIVQGKSEQSGEQLSGKSTVWLGELVDKETKEVDTHKSGAKDGDLVKVMTNTLYKIGNREHYGLDFKWLDDQKTTAITLPEWAMVVERYEWGNAYGQLANLFFQEKLQQNVNQEVLDVALLEAQQLHDQAKQIEKGEIAQINQELEKLRLEAKKINYLEQQEQLEEEEIKVQLQLIERQKQQLLARYQKLKQQLDVLSNRLRQLGYIDLRLADGTLLQVPLHNIVRAYTPNSLSWWDKMGHYFMNMWRFVSEDPREANTEGGVFPAIFGTVVLVIVMTIFVTPLGIVTAVYLREYAKQGAVVRLIRISVNNLAGVPSIVYGVFGLGFFVYFIGGSIDDLFFQYAKPSPTFGSPNMLWASLTLALLTLPVVIVSTEEGLNRIPRSIREGSLALGATRFETLMRTVLPMTSPAIMTGVILAIARAAGEVAPLMLVGVVKLAPDLVVDGTAPFVHLDRQFMHLGFHIFDVGFQSPNIEAARPLVYATAALLILLILVLNVTAIRVRNRLRERYKALENS